MATAPLNLDAFNADVRGWGQATLVALKGSAVRVGSRGAGTLVRTLKARYFVRYGEVYGLGFQFPRHGVFAEKGARRGHGGTKGSRWYRANLVGKDKNGKPKTGGWQRTNPRSFGKMGTGRSPEVPWLNPIIQARMDELADKVAGHYAEMALNSILIK